MRLSLQRRIDVIRGPKIRLAKFVGEDANSAARGLRTRFAVVSRA